MDHLIKNLPFMWKVIIASVLMTAPGAVLGGGALRDIATDRADQVKDFDFFIPAGTDEQKMKDMLAGYGYHQRHKCSAYFMKGSDGTVKQSIAFVNDRVTTRMPEVNLIWMAQGFEPIGRLAAFDFGICQIA
ncbi:hypothetical protein [Phyllobacterium endophyticum]|uniref:hypothetical protein n=1 Tax=Phyllobacterium endophyticum TaxID=1149773 RepID=UPI0011C86BBE|nr:hypothetical protein [Phyllobacterium endophyticum]TXR49906.1 hypothetical protein FVA77_07790 [Phyllobacterium endophyticum]